MAVQIIAFVYIIPIGMIQAITNQQVGLNVITELVIGYALPGRPIAMMMFKTWGYITMAQALTFTSDFKLGHYMKIPCVPALISSLYCSLIYGYLQAASDVLVPNDRHCHRWNRTARCPGLDVYQH
jgi:hypothetical protein